MHKLIRYLLTPSSADRPDIFQAAYLAFQLKAKKCPIQNLHHLPLPVFSTLSTSLEKTQKSSNDQKLPVQQPNTPIKVPSTSLNSTSNSNPPPQFGTPAAPIETTTSVNPRSRPKGTSASKGPLPLPLQVSSLSGKKRAELAKPEAPTVKATLTDAQGSNPFPVPDITQPSAPAFNTGNPFTSDVFQDPGPASISCQSNVQCGPNPPSGPSSLCSFPQGSEFSESASSSFSHGHRRIVSDTQTFQGYNLLSAIYLANNFDFSVAHNKDNPFLSGTGDFNSIEEQPKCKGSQPDLAKKVGGWNPFEDTVKFGEISEDLLFGNK